MSEVKRYVALGGMIEVEMGFGNGVFVEASDFDRVAAERDAALGLSVTKIMLDVVPGYEGMGEEVYAKSVEDIESAFTKLYDEVERLTDQRDALQQRLTAADERADVLTTALAGMLFAFDDGVGREWSEDLLDFARKLTAAKEFKAALKPAEGQRNQCDGCQAGIPVVNGAHRMGKPGGYPDTMSCTAKLYKP